MTDIFFMVPGLPIAQPRQRHAMIAGHVRNYTPSKHPVNDFKAAVKILASQKMSGALLDGPLMLSVSFLFPRPKSKVWKKREMPREPHTGRPDLENVIKSLQDALTNVVWRDDSQVFKVDASKFICAGDESPRTEVRVQSAPA